MSHSLRQNYYNPHVILGLHPSHTGCKVIRVWRPGATEIWCEVDQQIVPMERGHEEGVFEKHVRANLTPKDYRIYHPNGSLEHDPYACFTTWSDTDLYLFGRGTHYTLYRTMGGRLVIHEGILGAKFSVWAPNARSVALIGDFNFWDPRLNPMRCLGYSGVWELFLPGSWDGMRYKFALETHSGDLIYKADPYAVATEVRPATASILRSLDHHSWNDHQWMERRRTAPSIRERPLSIYEVHLGSWDQSLVDGVNYRALAYSLANYCCQMGFNAIELLPVQEHPLDESWGYQVSGFFAPTSRYGTLQEFQEFIDILHQAKIAVLLDWVPAHFPNDPFALAYFDGSPLYEHAHPDEGFHPHWKTHIFNYGRHEVSNFLLASALFWIEEMHVDGLRVDAVASMLYRDYGREGAAWVPNIYGGKENLEAIEFLKHLNSILHHRNPGVITIAEESTAFPGVTHAVEHGGLGFDLKWNMGWMNDTLCYFRKDPIFRSYHHHHLTFPLLFAFSEAFCLVLSHDEVVHGKGSLLTKMPGDLWQKFANLRLLVSYMFCQPGKKLLFMGGELGAWDEWHCKTSLNWSLLEFDTHRGVQKLVKDLNYLYQEHGSFWEKESGWETFEWVDFQDCSQSVISYLRKGKHETLLCIHHFTPNYYPHYFLPLPGVQSVEEVLNTDAIEYGGSGKTNPSVRVVFDQERPCGIALSLPPLGTSILSVNWV